MCGVEEGEGLIETVREGVGEKPIERFGARRWLSFWIASCGVADGLWVVDREEWEKRDTKIEEVSLRKFLWVPRDLRLEELVGLMETLSPGEGGEKTGEKVKKFGVVMSNTGVYLAGRAERLSRGVLAAEVIARELYRYGLRLQGKSDEWVRVDGVPRKTLSDEETEEVDRLIMGEELYQGRMFWSEDDEPYLRLHQPKDGHQLEVMSNLLPDGLFGGDLAMASEVAKKMLSLDGEHDSAMLMVASIAENDGNYLEALKWDKRMARRYPGKESFCSLGRTLVKLGRFEEALKTFGMAAKFDPDDTKVSQLIDKARARLEEMGAEKVG